MSEIEIVQHESENGGFELYPDDGIIYPDPYVPGAALDTDNDGVVDTVVESFGDGIQTTWLTDTKPWMIQRQDSQKRPVYVWLDENLDGLPEYTKTQIYREDRTSSITEEYYNHLGNPVRRVQYEVDRRGTSRSIHWKAIYGSSGEVRWEVQARSESTFWERFRLMSYCGSPPAPSHSDSCDSCCGTWIDGKSSRIYSGLYNTRVKRALRNRYGIRNQEGDFGVPWGCSKEARTMILESLKRLEENALSSTGCLAAIRPEWLTTYKKVIAESGIAIDCALRGSDTCSLNSGFIVGAGLPMGVELDGLTDDMREDQGKDFALVHPHIHLDAGQFKSLPIDARDQVLLHEILHAVTGFEHKSAYGIDDVFLGEGEERGAMEGKWTDEIHACSAFCGACESTSRFFTLRTHNAGEYESAAMACARCASPEHRMKCGGKNVPNVREIATPTNLPPLCTSAERPNHVPVDCSEMSNWIYSKTGIMKVPWEFCFEFNPELEWYDPFLGVECEKAHMYISASCDDRSHPVIPGDEELQAVIPVCPKACPTGSAGWLDATPWLPLPECDVALDRLTGYRHDFCKRPIKGRGALEYCRG